MKRPGYREAVEWLAHNDDCYWLADNNPMISVSAALVRDLFDVQETKLIQDIRRHLRRSYPDHEALRKDPT